MAAAEARMTRSTATRSATAHRLDSTSHAMRPQGRSSTRLSQPSQRQYGHPQLNVRSREEQQYNSGVFSHIWSWANTRRAPYAYVIVSVAILIASVFGSLMLRTAMVENAYSISHTQRTVSQLTQDVQQDRAKLDALEADLPNRANQLGMQESSESMTIDLGSAQ
ncbi:hypothetical protein ACFQY8_05345 [Alloscardovia venturai]|uniref:Cell division protein FtsL n=1 Tax=Alloscardovia venturai TaxID=1769421 RepID=A0ABW2Y5X9_9BIFI